MKKIYIDAQDKRSEYLKEIYSRNLYKKEDADVLILPIPFTRDGVNVNNYENISIEEYIKNIKQKNVIGGPVKESIVKLFEENNIKYIDIFKEDALAIKNAIPTAEGAIKKAIECTDIALHDAKVCVLGYGRCAKVLADKLKGLNAKVTVFARKEKDLALIKSLGYNSCEISKLSQIISSFDVIFNTIPACILTGSILENVNKDAVIIDIASFPGGVNIEEANKIGVKIYLELAIPTKIAPKSSAIYLKEEIDKYI